MASQIKNPKPIMLGQPMLLPMAERSIREQIESYLSRMRYAQPFPISSDDCYFGCMPPAARQWNRDGVFSTDSRPGRANNMLLTMHQASGSVGRLRNILHICAESEADYHAAQDGQRGHERLFWLEINGTFPAPRNSTTNPFYLPPDHEYYKEITEWVNGAYAIEDEMEETIKLIEGFQNQVQTPAVAAKVWPELVNFISFKKGATNNVSDAVRSRAMKAVPQIDRERIMFQLARAVMLPERQAPLKAWVKFYTAEIAK